MKQCTECGKRFTLVSTGQQVCSPACLCQVWDRLPKKSKTKSNARRYAKTVGLRSMGEVRFAAHLDEFNIKYKYEPEKFDYTPPKRRYTPDFRIKKRKRNGGYMYIEYKGNLKGTDRTKMILVKKEHPGLDIRFIFERASNKLNKKSKTTYAMWCEQHGFPWAEKQMPKEWRKE